ncbi:MAG: FAD binding domain-containing protein [Rhodothermales bacterium]
MKPAPFTYFASSTEDEALAHLATYGYEASVLAGGQSLVPTMNFRLAQPSVLVDLNRIPTLAYIRADEAGVLRLGAMTRQRAVECSTLVRERSPLLYETMPHIAHPPIRNRGTVGGSIAHADPAAELPAVMLVLDARFRLRNRHAERWLAASSFYVGMFSTAREPEELLVEIAVPSLPPRSGGAFREVARRHGDYALVGVAALVTLDADGCCRTARIALLSVGDGPVEAHEAAGILVGQPPTAEVVRAAAEAAATRDIDPAGDIHASAAFRRHLARVLTTDVLTQAFERARFSGRETQE